METPGRLNGNVQYPFQCLFGSSFVELFSLDPVLKTPPINILGKDDHLFTHASKKAAGNNMGMLGKVKPGLKLGKKKLAVLVLFRFSFLYGKALVSLKALYQVNLPHPPFAQHLFHPVVVEKGLPWFQFPYLTTPGARFFLRRRCPNSF